MCQAYSNPRKVPRYPVASSVGITSGAIPGPPFQEAALTWRVVAVSIRSECDIAFAGAAKVFYLGLNLGAGPRAGRHRTRDGASWPRRLRGGISVLLVFHSPFRSAQGTRIWEI